MGITKTDLFNDTQNELSHIAKVLGHPARIAILDHLLKINSCINGDLVQELGLAQPTISQHLKELKSIGLIKGTVEGTSMCYCIDYQQWNTVKTLFNSFFDQLPQPNDCC